MAAGPSGEALAANLAWWGERAALHAGSDFYNIQAVIDGEQRLHPHEIEEVGSVEGLDLAHFQCHLGTETLGWARLGARAVGLDFSPEVVETARGIAARSGVDVRYEVGNVYDAPDVLGEQSADVVYVNTGSIHYVEDLRRWGRAVHGVLRPGGRLYINEIHPVSNVLDDSDDATVAAFARDYFYEGPAEYDEPGSYADTEEETQHNRHIVWDRPISTVMTAIIGAGLQVTKFTERPGQDFKQLPFLEQNEEGLWVPPAGHGVHPATYSLMAVKPAA